MKNKKTLIALIALIAVCACLIVVFFATREKGTDDAKTITVEMIYDDVDRTVTIKTEQEYLSGALLDEGLIEGEESAYGLYITTVDGRVVDDSKNEWWMLTQDGVMTDTGADGVVLHDGDRYELTLDTY